jgi:hypothetical protein
MPDVTTQVINENVEKELSRNVAHHITLHTMKQAAHSNGDEICCWANNYGTSWQSSGISCSKEDFMSNNAEDEDKGKVNFTL